MKHWFSPLLILLLLFALSLANARFTEQCVDEWCAKLESTLSAAQDDRWADARQTLDAVYTSWCARQTYFHIMTGHAELDETESLFAAARSYATDEESADFRAGIAQLLTQLALLRETEAISMRNIL